MAYQNNNFGPNTWNRNANMYYRSSVKQVQTAAAVAPVKAKAEAASVKKSGSCEANQAVQASSSHNSTNCTRCNECGTDMLDKALMYLKKAQDCIEASMKKNTSCDK